MKTPSYFLTFLIASILSSTAYASSSGTCQLSGKENGSPYKLTKGPFFAQDCLELLLRYAETQHNPSDAYTLNFSSLLSNFTVHLSFDSKSHETGLCSVMYFQKDNSGNHVSVADQKGVLPADKCFTGVINNLKTNSNLSSAEISYGFGSVKMLATVTVH